MPTIWQLSLQQASWRSVPFGVRATNRGGGRRVALHEYPYQDVPYAEDLGRATRQFSFSGFVVGDDAGDQAEQLITACEVKGPGQLVHPIYGSFTSIQLITFTTEERWDNGRVVEFKFTFVETGQPLYPTTGADTQAATQTAGVNAANALVVNSAANDQTIATTNGGYSGATTAPVPGAVDFGSITIDKYSAIQSGSAPTQVPTTTSAQNTTPGGSGP